MLDNRFLAGPIGRGHEVVLTLDLDLEVPLAKLSQENLATLESRLLRDFQKSRGHARDYGRGRPRMALSAHSSGLRQIVENPTTKNRRHSATAKLPPFERCVLSLAAEA